MAVRRLGIGFIGSGFNARFHMQSLVGVRDADARGVWSPNTAHAEEAAALARSLDVGDARVFRSIGDMVADPAIDAIWICGPNQARIENVEEMCHALSRGQLLGVACEKPLARNVAEAERVLALVQSTGVRHGYLENQVYAPQVEHGRTTVWSRGARYTGRPYLARAAEEHSGPHRPWFWQGRLQGGGVLNDMMCHSALLVRHLLTGPGETLMPTQITAHIASLKWSRPEYAAELSRRMGNDIDYTRAPSEDFASMMVEFATPDGYRVLGEATTSWSYVGAGLRLSAELLGPEYSMSWNTLNSGLQLFFSRAVAAPVGEDMVEKQNAEIGLLPVVTNEAQVYGYEGENRHMVRAFLRGQTPSYTFEDGVDVVKMLMTAYMSAEQGRTLPFPPPGLDTFVPRVAQGTWQP